MKWWMWALLGLGAVFLLTRSSADSGLTTGGDGLPAGVKSNPSTNPFVSKLTTGINKDPNKVYSPFRIASTRPYGTVLHTETATSWRT
jgi:hypothetical protein